MLENNYQRRLKELLEAAKCEIALPAEWQDMFSNRGKLESRHADQRRFVRSHFPSKALLEIGQTVIGVPRSPQFSCIITRDLSRNGIAFLHHEQVFPGEKPMLWMTTGKMKCLVVRCTRHNARCYEVGASFSVDKSSSW